MTDRIEARKRLESILAGATAAGHQTVTVQTYDLAAILEPLPIFDGNGQRIGLPRPPRGGQ